MNSEQREMFCDVLIPRLVNFTQVCTHVVHHLRGFKDTELVYLYIGNGQYDCDALDDMPEDAEIVASIDPNEPFTVESLLDIHRQIEMAIDAMGERLLVPTSDRLLSFVVFAHGEGDI